MKLAAVALLGLVWAGLTTPKAPPPLSGYFPPIESLPSATCGWLGLGRRVPALTDFEAKWYSEQLAAAHEPSLWTLSRVGAERQTGLLRFTWLRSFHPPIFVRIDGLATRARG